MRAIFILVPSLHPAGPIKGAVALANAIAGQRTVTLVALKNGPGADAYLNDRVRVVSLAGVGNGVQRVAAYRRMLIDAGGRNMVASISLGFSADMVNLCCRGQAVTCSSVRGNLPRNYQLDYGPAGVPLALGHLAALRGLDHVVAMTASMARQVGRYAGRLPSVIGNFVDEAVLESYRNDDTRTGALRFVFLASLSPRKRPDVLIDALARIRGAGVDAHLDLIGDGPMKSRIIEQVDCLGLTSVVNLHGHLRDPYPLLAHADALVLPSLSEGLSRAGLEAMHLGVPCVLRDVDGNAELVQNGINGALFRQDGDLAEAMLAVADFSRRTLRRKSLLPPGYRQHVAAHWYLELVEAVT